MFVRTSVEDAVNEGKVVGSPSNAIYMVGI